MSIEVERIFDAKAEEIWNSQVEVISRLITQKLEAMVEANDPYSNLICSKRKAICTLLPYAVLSARRQRGRTDIDVLRIAKISVLGWLSAWALQPPILAETEEWSKPPSPPNWFWGRQVGTTTGDIVRHIRELGDMEILKSYFLLVWSEWSIFSKGCFKEMKISIQEGFGGMERWHDREELIARLDQALGRLGQGLTDLQHEGRALRMRMQECNVHRTFSQYENLKTVLLELHEQALLRKPPSRSPSTSKLIFSVV